MSAELEAVVIYDSILFQQGHMVHRWAETVERNFVRHAKRAAPMRSGALIRGISGASTKVGPKHWQVIIHSAAPHSLYVLGGTTGPITTGRFHADSGKPVKMLLPAGYGWPAIKAESVSGQRANNFFGRAARRTAVTNPSLRGFSPGYGY